MDALLGAFNSETHAENAGADREEKRIKTETRRLVTF